MTQPLAPELIDKLIADLTYWRAQIVRKPTSADCDYAQLSVMRAINAIPALYTDNMHDMITDAASDFGEDADGSVDHDALDAARERGYPGNVYMAERLRDAA